MPTDEELVRYARRHQDQLLTLRDRSGRTLEQLWRQHATNPSDEALAAWLDASVPVLEAVNTAAATSSAAYVQTYAAAATSTPPIGTVIDAIDLGRMVAARGVANEDVLTRPFVTMRTSLAEGADLADAIETGRARAVQIGRTDPMLSARAGASHAMIADPRIVGYRRVPDGGACSFCLLAATQRYHDSDLMPLHPNCGCSVAPIIGTSDPGQIIDREALARLKAEGVVDEISLRRRISSTDQVVGNYEAKAAYWREQARTTTNQAAETRYAKRADDWARKAEDRAAQLEQDRDKLKALQAGRTERISVVEHGELGPVLGPAGRTSETAVQNVTIPTVRPSPASVAAAETVTAPAAATAVKAGRYKPDSPEVIRAAQRRGVSPEKAAADLNEKAARRAAEQAASRAEARSLTVDHPDVIRMADRHGVTPDEIMSARQRVPEVRRVIADEAARVQSEAFAQLDHWEARQVRRPPRAGDASRRGEYDWLEQVDDREKARLSRAFYNDSATSTPDLIAENISNALGRDVSTGEAMEMWLNETRRLEAAGALRRGKLPSDRAYSGQIDPDLLLPGVAGDGYQITKIVGVDDLEAAGHIAGIDRTTMIDEAEQYLGEALNPKHGQPPFRMSFQSWEEDVRDLEYAAANGGLTATEAARYAELVPQYIDEAGLGYEELYTRIVATARRAGQEIPAHAVIPW